MLYDTIVYCIIVFYNIIYHTSSYIMICYSISFILCYILLLGPLTGDVKAPVAAAEGSPRRLPG